MRAKNTANMNTLHLIAAFHIKKICTVAIFIVSGCFQSIIGSLLEFVVMEIFRQLEISISKPIGASLMVINMQQV